MFIIQYNQLDFRIIMFSQLLEQCKQVFKSADQVIKENKKILQESRLVFPLNQSNIKIDPTKTFANATSFPKADRFKHLQKQELNLTDVSLCQSEKIETPGDTVKKCFTFTKGQRFLNEKIKEKNAFSSTILQPNYEAVKRNTRQAAIIRPPTRKDLSKSNISQATAASMNQVGPGKYYVQKIELQPKRSAAFSKQKRFKKETTQYQDNPIFINQNQTKKRPPSTALLRKKITKNAKLISKGQQQEMRQRLKMIYWQSIPLELDRLFKTNLGPILRQNYFNIKKMAGRQKRCAMLMMLDRLNMLRGGFQNDIRQNIQDIPGGVVYRKSTPKPFRFSQMQPGPDFYYPQDDLTKPGMVGFSFVRQGQQPQKVVYDDRDYQINEQIFKKQGNIVINPIHKQHTLTLDQMASLNRGPGYYDCLFGQIEKRDDIGVIKFTQINEKNARQNNCVDIKKDVNDAAYFPSYGAVDPNVPAPLYKQNADVKPMHLPDKVLFPEHWLFYDGDLNKVRAQIAKNVILAKNMDFKTYKAYTKRFEAFKDYLKSRQPIPEVGEYEVKFTQLDPHLEGFDMTKKPEKTLIQPIRKEEGDVQGDNLLLNPKEFQDHLPSFDLKKMVGRPQFSQQTSADDEAKQGDRLILQPKPIQKKLPNINFQRMKGRQDPLDNLDPQQPVQGNVLILNPKPIEKHIPQIDFRRQPLKHQPEILQLSEGKETLILQPKPVQRKIKGLVEMQRMSNVRLVPVLREKSRNKNTDKKEGSISKRNKQQSSQNQSVNSQQQK